MSIKNACTALAVGFFCLVSLPAQAVIVNYTAFLSPANEVPVVTNAPTATGGGGIIFHYDTTSNLLSWTIAFEGLANDDASLTDGDALVRDGPIILPDGDEAGGEN